jgi:hypothetical protein
MELPVFSSMKALVTNDVSFSPITQAPLPKASEVVSRNL